MKLSKAQVLIPLRIRSISTVFNENNKGDYTMTSLNPFTNQVYFHRGPGKALCGAALRWHFREPPAILVESGVCYLAYFSILLI